VLSRQFLHARSLAQPVLAAEILYDAASSYTEPGGAIANRKTWTWQAAGDNTSRGSRRPRSSIDRPGMTRATWIGMSGCFVPSQHSEQMAPRLSEQRLLRGGDEVRGAKAERGLKARGFGATHDLSARTSIPSAGSWRNNDGPDLRADWRWIASARERAQRSLTP
jgi:hypothetical protein